MKRFFLNDAVDLVGLGARSIQSDSFTKCFEPITPLEMHHSGALYIFSLLIRYALCFPLRIIFFIFGTLIFFICFIIGSITKNDKIFEKSFLFYCNIFCISFGARIRNHGKKKLLNVPNIYVANHTSFLDFIVLSSYKFCHASVAENHSGLFGFFLKKILHKNGSLNFRRSEKSDKKMIKEKIKQHIMSKKTPMLLFPEGTCVNNKYTVMFQKSTFELDATICPVAIKYKRQLFDPYWNRRKHNFTEHVLYLMSRWMIEVDVYWLDPVKRHKNENLLNFIERVKKLISDKAGLIPTKWNGYMKNQIIIHDVDILRSAYNQVYLKVFEEREKKENERKMENEVELKEIESNKRKNKTEKNKKEKLQAVKLPRKKYEFKVSDSLEVQYFDFIEYEKFIKRVLNKYSSMKFKGNSKASTDNFFLRTTKVGCSCKEKKIMKKMKFMSGMCRKEAQD